MCQVDRGEWLDVQPQPGNGRQVQCTDKNRAQHGRGRQSHHAIWRTGRHLAQPGSYGRAEVCQRGPPAGACFRVTGPQLKRFGIAGGDFVQGHVCPVPEILRAERRAVVWLQSKLQGQDTGPWRGLASTAPKLARKDTCPLYLRSAHIRGKAKGVMRRHGRGNEDQAHGGAFVQARQENVGSSRHSGLSIRHREIRKPVKIRNGRATVIAQA